MTPEEVAALRAAHRPMIVSRGRAAEHQRCYRCDENWPCPVESLAVAVEEARAQGAGYSPKRTCMTCGLTYHGSIMTHAEDPEHRAIVAGIRGW